MKGVKGRCFCLLDMQICSVFVTVAVADLKPDQMILIFGDSSIIPAIIHYHVNCIQSNSKSLALMIVYRNRFMPFSRSFLLLDFSDGSRSQLSHVFRAFFGGFGYSKLQNVSVCLNPKPKKGTEFSESLII